MNDTLIPLCRLYENTSKTNGKRYFVGHLSFTTKLLVFRIDNARENEPQWQVYISEREPKMAGNGRERQPASPRRDGEV